MMTEVRHGGQAPGRGGRARHGAEVVCDAPGRFVAVVDACGFGRIGLDAALRSVAFVTGRTWVAIMSTPGEVLLASRPYVLNGRLARYLVVRLPSSAQEALLLLLQLSDIVLSDAAHFHRVVVLSPFDEVVMRRLVAVLGMPQVRVADARLPLAALCGAVLFADEATGPERAYLPPALSVQERNALRLSLQCRSVPLQARLRHVSAKTVYSQRFRGLAKLGVPDIRTLLRLLVKRARPVRAGGA